MRFEFIKAFKFKSIFIKTISVLSILLIILMIIFYFFANNLISETLKEKTYSSNLSLLDNTSSSVNNTLTILIQSMRQTLQNQYIVSEMIKPDANNYQRSVNIIKELNKAKKVNPIIRDVLLYIPTENVLFLANGTISSVDDYYDKKIIDVYNQNQIPGDIISYNETVTEIKKIDGRIILYQDFFPPAPNLKKIGTMIYEINTEGLYMIITGKMNFLDNDIYIYDQFDNPILPKQIDYTKIDKKNKSFLKFDDRAGSFSGKEVNDTQKVYFYFQSDLTSWKYIYPVNSSSLQFGFHMNYGSVVPLLVLFFLAGLVLTFYMSASIYKPINQLLVSISQTGKRAPQINTKTMKNELDFFSTAYDDAVVRIDQLSAVIDGISPAVLERLLTNLIFGRDIATGSIQETLDGIGNPFSIEGKYIVLSASILHPNKKEISEIEMNLYIIGINNIVRSQLVNRAKYFLIRTGDSTIALILGFGNEASVMQIKQTAVSLTSELTAKALNLPYEIVFGKGNIYNNIKDIRYSYLEAEEDLSYRLYYGEDIQVNARTEDGPCLDKRYFTEKTKQIILQIDDGNYPKATELMKHIIAEVAAGASEVCSARSAYETFLDCMIDKIIEMKIKDTEVIFSKRKEFDKHFGSSANIGDLEKYIEEICTDAIELIDSHNKKSQHRYIVRAKEYIDSNYSNSSLSLNMVADYIGTNSSYLSRLFNEILNLGFAEYLNKLRVEKAKQLLDETELSLKEIGYKTGFNSMQSFIRVFKKYENISPGKYTRKAR